VNALLERVRRLGEVNMQTAQSWRLAGRCRGSDPSIFYPPPEDEILAEEAKLICSTCSVRQPCLEYALSTREKHGVWGGLTERERRRVLRQRRKSA
jgi:WhiB family redox-sensing transcriptional regulator